MRSCEIGTRSFPSYRQESSPLLWGTVGKVTSLSGKSTSGILGVIHEDKESIMSFWEPPCPSPRNSLSERGTAKFVGVGGMQSSGMRRKSVSISQNSGKIAGKKSN